MRFVRFLLRVVFLGTATAAFFGVPLCWVSLKVQGLAWGLGATLLFGRFFCRVMCPLGIVQSFVNWLTHPRRHVRRVCTRLPVSKRQWLVRGSVLAGVVALGAAGCLGLAEELLPVSIFGRALTLWTPGVVVAAVVLLLSVFGDGRFWCNWVCPFGTIYALVAKVAIFRDKVGVGCGNCRKCLEATRERAGSGAAGGDVTRRDAVKGLAFLAAAEGLPEGEEGLVPVTLPGLPARGGDVLPPGAAPRRTFALKCAGCQLCVANCPGHCLVPSTALRSFGQPVMDFRRGSCIPTCVKCGSICPEGAIAKLQEEMRPNVHMGHAVWKKSLCVRTTKGDACTACLRKCPVQAIHLVDGFPLVDRDRCIGCGACEHVCPARPMPAIYVKGYDMQRIVKPISESDLLAEMYARLEAGAAVVVAKSGVIVAEERGRGLKPLVRLLDDGKLGGALVVDKVIGRAAAAICAVGGTKKVVTPLAGAGAEKLLAERGITLLARRTVPLVLNRDKSGSCPMEAAVKDLDDPAKMLEAIRTTMEKLK